MPIALSSFCVRAFFNRLFSSKGWVSGSQRKGVVQPEPHLTPEGDTLTSPGPRSVATGSVNNCAQLLARTASSLPAELAASSSCAAPKDWARCQLCRQRRRLCPSLRVTQKKGHAWTTSPLWWLANSSSSCTSGPPSCFTQPQLHRQGCALTGLDFILLKLTLIVTIWKGQPPCMPHTATQGGSILDGLPPPFACFSHVPQGVPCTGVLAVLPSRTTHIRSEQNAGEDRSKTRCPEDGSSPLHNAPACRDPTPGHYGAAKAPISTAVSCFHWNREEKPGPQEHIPFSDSTLPVRLGGGGRLGFNFPRQTEGLLSPYRHRTHRPLRAPGHHMLA